MYILSSVKENVLVKFLSSISLEMFIIQFIPIYIMMNDLHVKSTTEMFLLVLGLDISCIWLHKGSLQDNNNRQAAYFDVLHEKVK
jgi:hypothetical protein